MMETTLNGATNFLYFFFNGQIINRREFGHGNTLDSYIVDQLGNTNIVSGYMAWDYSYYYPFGGERVYQSNVGNHYKFTGKERDPESGLDNFGARFNASSMGRFMSPDPANIGVNRLNPQSWNAYSYSLNNPLNLTDPTGLYVCEDSTKCDSQNDKNFAQSLADAQTAANALKDQYGANSDE